MQNEKESHSQISLNIKKKYNKILVCSCGKEFSATGSTSKYCSIACRNLSYKSKKHCQHCNKDITDKQNSRKFCSTYCCNEHRLQRKNQGVNGINYIECPICKSHVKQITSKHAIMHGFLNAKEMQIQLKIPAITCRQKKEQSQGEKNPGYQHGGKFSKFSKQFIHGYDKEWVNSQIEKYKEDKKANPEKYPNRIEYWIKQTSGDIKLANEKYTKHQTRDLNYFVRKYGEEDGQRRHQEKTRKWMKSFKKQNFSKISQELFYLLVEKLTNIDGIYFATFERQDMQNYKNKEYRLNIEGSCVLPDFIDLLSKKIIEFDGDYWHGKGRANPQREQLRDEKIKNAGYQIIHIQESAYKQNREKVIHECINFLIK